MKEAFQPIMILCLRKAYFYQELYQITLTLEEKQLLRRSPKIHTEWLKKF